MERLPLELVDEMMGHHSDVCRRLGTLLQFMDPDPLHDQVIEISPIRTVVNKLRPHHLLCNCCCSNTFAGSQRTWSPVVLAPAQWLVRSICSAFSLSLSKRKPLLAQ